jgi:hypothetical protein
METTLPSRRTLRSERRRRVLRWGVIALVAFVLLAPVGVIASCADGPVGGECTTQPASLVGMLLGIGYPAI